MFCLAYSLWVRTGVKETHELTLNIATSKIVSLSLHCCHCDHDNYHLISPFLSSHIFVVKIWNEISKITNSGQWKISFLVLSVHKAGFIRLWYLLKSVSFFLKIDLTSSVTSLGMMFVRIWNFDNRFDFFERYVTLDLEKLSSFQGTSSWKRGNLLQCGEGGGERSKKSINWGDLKYWSLLSEFQ